MDGGPEDIRNGKAGGPGCLAGQNTTRIDAVADRARKRPGNRDQSRSVAGNQGGQEGRENLRHPVGSSILERMDSRPYLTFVHEQRPDEDAGREPEFGGSAQ